MLFASFFLRSSVCVCVKSKKVDNFAKHSNLLYIQTCVNTYHIHPLSHVLHTAALFQWTLHVLAHRVLVRCQLRPQWRYFRVERCKLARISSKVSSMRHTAPMGPKRANNPIQETQRGQEDNLCKWNNDELGRARGQMSEVGTTWCWNCL